MTGAHRAQSPVLRRARHLIDGGLAADGRERFQDVSRLQGACFILQRFTHRLAQVRRQLRIANPEPRFIDQQAARRTEQTLCAFLPASERFFF